jgi:hypothetical protein
MAAVTKFVLDRLDDHMRALGLEPVGYRSNGRAIWPIRGGDGTGGAGEGGAGAGDAGGENGGQGGNGGGQNGGTGKVDGEFDFPENTPLSEMTEAQKSEYWRHKARKHEDRSKTFEGLTAEQLADLRAKAERADKLDYELSSDKEKAVADAQKNTREQVIAEVRPEVMQFALDAAAARAGVSEDDLKAAAEFVDHSKFFDANGKVDAAKVKTFVESIKPARGDNGGGQKGPSSAGHGRQHNHQTGTARDKGHAEAIRRGYAKTDA